MNIGFEAEYFFKTQKIWDLYNKNKKYGTLGCFGEAEATKEPGAAQKGQAGLHLYGASQRVEFRPVNQNQRLVGLEFWVRLENESPMTQFKVQVKSFKKEERWKTVFTYSPDSTPSLNTTDFTFVKISSEVLTSKDAQKIRFKLDGPVQNGAFIDNLKVSLKQ